MMLQLNDELLHECLYVDELWYGMYMLKWYDDFMTLQLNDVYLWDYNVDVVIVVDVVDVVRCCWCCHCCWCRQVVEVVRCCWLSCWVHAYSYKVGGLMPYEC